MMSVEASFQRLYYNDFYNTDLGRDLDVVLRVIIQSGVEFNQAITTFDDVDEYYLDVFETTYNYIDKEERDSDLNTLSKVFIKYNNEINTLENDY